MMFGQNDFTLFLSSCFLPLNYPFSIITIVIINLLLYGSIYCLNNNINITSFGLTML